MLKTVLKRPDDYHERTAQRNEMQEEMLERRSPL